MQWTERIMSLRSSREMPSSWLLESISCFLSLSFVPVPFLLSPLQELLEEGVGWAHRAWSQRRQNLGGKGNDGCGKGKRTSEWVLFQTHTRAIGKRHLCLYLYFRLSVWAFGSGFIKLETFKRRDVRCQSVPIQNFQWMGSVAAYWNGALALRTGSPPPQQLLLSPRAGSSSA